jgi:hypothetical protein
MNGSELVTLKGGVAVPLPALRLAWTLEAKGCRFNLADDGVLLVGPGDLLTPEDREAIAAWKTDLLTIVAYVEGRMWDAS